MRGPLDALVNNAEVTAFVGSGNWDALDAETFRCILGVSVIGPDCARRGVAPQREARRDRMVAIQREADEALAPEVARKHKVSEQTIYTWRHRFGELQPADIKRLRQLEAENAKLKKLVAHRDLDIETMKEINRRKW